MQFVELAALGATCSGGAVDLHRRFIGVIQRDQSVKLTEEGKAYLATLVTDVRATVTEVADNPDAPEIQPTEPVEPVVRRRGRPPKTVVPME